MLKRVKDILDLWKLGKLKIDTNGHSFEQQIIKDMDLFHDKFYETYNLSEDAIIESDMTDIYKEYPKLFDLKNDKTHIERDGRIIFQYTKEEVLKSIIKDFELIDDAIEIKIFNDNYNCKNEKCYSSPDCLHHFTAFRLVVKDNVITTTRNGENPKCGSIMLNDGAKNQENMFGIIYGLLVHNDWRRRSEVYYYTEGLDVEIVFKNRKYSLFYDGKEEVLSKDGLTKRLKELLPEDSFRKEGE